MARKPTGTSAPAELIEVAPQYEQLTQQALDAQANFDRDKDEVFAAGVDIGRLEALDFVLTVGSEAVVAVFESVKKSKAWRFLRNPKSSHGENFSSLDEFCEVKLGKSYKRLQAIAANRNLIGQEAFEQAEKLGLRQVDYNAIKALPAPDQELIRRAVEEAQSRDEVLDVLQELAARNAKAREKLEADVAQLKVDNEYEAEQRKKLQAKTEQLEKQLRKGGPQVQPYSERLAEFRTGVGELQDVAGKSLVQMAKQIDALAQWWQQEVLAAPDYDPQAPVRMPPELLDTARALAEHIELLAGGVGALQHKVAQAFGAELEMQPQYLMRDPMGGQMGDAGQDGDGVDEGEAAYADAGA